MKCNEELIGIGSVLLCTRNKNHRGSHEHRDSNGSVVIKWDFNTKGKART